MTKKYSKEHEWIELVGDVGTVGITNYAQEKMGDVVFVELPKIGAAAAQNDQIAVVESVKAASEIYAPVAGTVTAVNEALVKEPQLVNRAAEGEGWFFKLKIANAKELDALMNAAAYAAFTAAEG